MGVENLRLKAQEELNKGLESPLLGWALGVKYRYHGTEYHALCQNSEEYMRGWCEMDDAIKAELRRMRSN